MGNIKTKKKKKIGDQFPVNLSQMHVSIPALQCWRVSAVEFNPLAPASSEVQLGAVLAGHWQGEEKQVQRCSQRRW